MNRRNFLGAAVGAVVSFVLPAPRKHLDLRAWCGREGILGKYDVTLPWELDDWTYATDARACLRVRPATADAPHHLGAMPPFGTLPWDHDRLRGWREMPRLEPLLARDSQCPACVGTGFEGGAVGSGCPKCGGTGHDWVGSGYAPAVPVPCRACAGRGVMPPPGAKVCPVCRGKAIGTFPSVVCLDGRYFAADLYERVRSLGGEAVLTLWRSPNSKRDDPLLSFRCDGGEGLLLGMDPSVRHRLVKGGVA